MISIKSLKVWLQYVMPQHALSRLAGWLANHQCVWLKNCLIRFFLSLYSVDMTLAVEPDPFSYKSFNHFFTRVLRAEQRPLTTAPHPIASPVDGCISQLGDITGGRIIQAKHFDYTVQDLLGGDAARAAPFAQGVFMTLYLAPRDYHRVHMPVAGTLRTMIYVPGVLFSVNPTTAATVPNLFARNERVVLLFDTAYGPLAVVLVGAMLVASITIACHGLVAPARDRHIQVWDYTQQDKTVALGAELGHFQLGSTVVMLLGNSAAHWLSSLAPEQHVCFGALLGHTVTRID